MSTGLRAAALAIRLVWLSCMVALFTLMVAPHVLPALGRQVLVVRGASMQPAILIGSVVMVGRILPTDVSVGDVITFRAPNGAVVTHRVLSVIDAGDVSFSTKGDANSSADPVVVPGSAVIGRVELAIAGLGDFMTALGSTMGALGTVGFLMSLLLTGWFFDELAATLRRSPTRRTVAPAVR
jgi:signal peptidase I